MTTLSTHDQIAIIDFGSQYTHLLARRIRELGVYTEIYPNTIKAHKISPHTRGIILSGGPNSVHDHTALFYDPKIFNLALPLLGLCYGHQLIGQHFGGKVLPGDTKEYGKAELDQLSPSSIFKNIKRKNIVWMSHGDSVVKLPPNFKAIAQTKDCKIAAMENMKERIFGFQFHPEVRHTNCGTQILFNFVSLIARAKTDWKVDNFVAEIIERIKKIAGAKKVFLLVSGGVDSSVSFALLEKALGKKNVFGIHIDNAFLRFKESAHITKILARAGFDNLHVVDASDQFLKRLAGVSNPEEKRTIIGNTFLDVAEQEAQKLGIDLSNWLIGQGTIYPDTIESGGTKHAHKIKTHHNRVEKINALIAQGKIIEPIADLYKDEVRLIGKRLKLNAGILNRHPFPGPGLAIRVLSWKAPVLPRLTHHEIKSFSQNYLQKTYRFKKDFEISILPIQSVGVQGDQRSYAHPALLQGITDWNMASGLATALCNKFAEINRAALLIHPKKISPELIKFIPGTLTKERLALLKKADYKINQRLKALKLYNAIWQCPIILAPLTLQGGETIILRPVASEEGMTANFYRMNRSALQDITRALIAVQGIDMILYDITNKPPGTIEWE
ncbi:MAG: Bifunctional GMP synthase/glutamine amidotransferase protein [Parcubacteria group bacterium GW2011_GWA2_44_12]|nr:MAG: Bifunctional GMP synthase/glutamine amidotransferase protein [Parcubacteria group bacterium GW2011_GWA2_44_12]